MRQPITIHHVTRAALAGATLLVLTAFPAFAQQVIVDNVDPGFTVLAGPWNSGAFPTPWGADYRWRITTAGGTDAVEWRPNLPQTGNYRVEVWYVEGGNRAPDATYTVHHNGGSTPLAVDQRSGGSQWNTLGIFNFTAGQSGYVTMTNDASPSVVMADAVRFTLETGVAPEEFRGMWASRFEWPSSNRTTVENNILDILNNLAANNFNALLFQVRGQCDTLYPSPEEPWSPLVSPNGNEPAGWNGFDPLAFAITEAHARGIELHAYINTHTAWQASGCTNPPGEPTYDLDHVFWDHFNASDPGARDWLVHNEFGNPVQCEESNYTWIAPGVPDAMAYVRRQIMYVVENYDVDGVHFDRIRTPGNEYSRDPISEARRLGDGNPDGLAFADWTRDQITRFNRDIYAQIAEVNPQVKVSSAPLGLYRGSSYPPSYPQSDCGFFYGYSCVLQDAQAWLAAGAHDFIVPQIYWADGGALPDFSDILPDWVANNAGRHVYAGQITSVGLSALLDQISVTRSMGAEGNVVFSFGSFDSNNYWPSYSGIAKPYFGPATTPAMPWKDNPTQGIILGTVTDFTTGLPVTDVHVTRTGSSYTALTSGDGLYSLLLIDPGTYTLTFDKTGLGSREICNVVVGAGDVIRIDTSLGGPQVPGDFDGDGDVDLRDWPGLVACLAGPSTSYPASDCCLAGDADGDLDVDLSDVAQIEAALP
jgi:uncharacterized lipoprotein YddW (UPF0748 family)